MGGNVNRGGAMGASKDGSGWGGMTGSGKVGRRAEVDIVDHGRWSFATTCVLALVWCTGLVACAQSYGSKRLLARSVDDFNAQVRWGRQEQAAAYLVPALRNQYLDRVERLGQKVHITGVEILRVIWRKGTKEALVRLRFEWQRSDEILLHQTLVVETWRKSGKGWTLVRIRQLTKPLMPLLPPGPRPLDTQ